MSIHATDLIVDRRDLSRTDCVMHDIPDAPPEGQVLLRIDRFALTANNITYAVAPAEIGYWNFFPVEKEHWGRVPVWGFGEVIASSHPEVTNGTRVYGYFPMSTHLMVTPGKVDARGFSDVAAHRSAMAQIYNRYSITSADPGYRPEREGMISLFRPLFTTSFLLDDYHRRNAFFGAECLLLSSASSKTAIGLAFLLGREPRENIEIVGLTSSRNAAFTERLGLYDRVVVYGDADTLDIGPTAFVDMAGDADLLRRIHGHFDSALMNSCRVGLTHWQTTSNWIEGLSGGPKPSFFFAPTYAQDRVAEWGMGEFQKRLGHAWAAFMDHASHWVRVTEASGPKSVQEIYLNMLRGDVDPAAGLVLSMQGS